MPFIPHTDADVTAMLEAIGADSIEALFDEIPAALRCGELNATPEGLGEMQVTRLMRARAAQDKPLTCFAGAGAYDHHIPAAVWELTTRGEFYSAYTPYQAEASQGTLQLIYEFQTMMTSLTGLDVANASLYDGGSALAEAVLMAVRANRRVKSGRVLVAGAVNPTYRKVTEAIVDGQDIRLDVLPLDTATGGVDMDALPSETDHTALVIQLPDYFGGIDDVHALTDWAHARNMLVIAVVNPTALAVLTPPGAWGEAGADIACGEGQPLGVPMSSGGPYFGFMCCKKALMRQLPGRIVGRTLDLDGKPGYTLTLQAREQHIRRSKATSNICTNQGLLVTAATIYMSIVGAEGLARVAADCHRNTRRLLDRLSAIDGVRPRLSGARFHEAVVELPVPVAPLLGQLAEAGILGGVDVSETYPELGDALLICATEMRSNAEIDHYADTLRDLLANPQEVAA